jgi:hypothetical protein
MGNSLPLLRDFLGPNPRLNESVGLIDVVRFHVLKDIKDKPSFKEVLAGGMRIAPEWVAKPSRKRLTRENSHLSMDNFIASYSVPRERAESST